MIKAAVGTHSELLAAAPPCRQSSCESTEPVAISGAQGRTGEVPPAHRMLEGLWDPQSYHASSLPGGGRELQDQNFVLNPPSQNTCVALAEGGKKLMAAGLGTIYPLSRGSEVGDAMKSPSLGMALPCLLPQPRGLRPTAANGEPMLLLTRTCWALQSANQGLSFALREAWKAFGCRSAMTTPVVQQAASLSIPLMPARLTPALCTGEQSVGGSQQEAYGHRGLK